LILKSRRRRQGNLIDQRFVFGAHIYVGQRIAMYSHTPPAPPPKPASRMSTPSGAHSPRPAPLPETRSVGEFDAALSARGQPLAARHQQAQTAVDPGEQWLPRFLQDKSYGRRF